MFVGTPKVSVGTAGPGVSFVVSVVLVAEGFYNLCGTERLSRKQTLDLW